MNGVCADGRRSWGPVLAVVVLALGLRIWVVTCTEVAARDSIGFIKYALRYENEPFTKVLREAEQPPGYPLAVLAASWPVRAMNGGITPHNMMLAAQIASAVFGVLLVFPMIGLGTELIDRRTGLVAAALFQCLPAWVKLTSDGVAEAMFLFFVAMALWWAARAFRLTSWLWFAGAGLMAGAAFLTRPEGAEIVVAIGIVLMALLIRRLWSWQTTSLNLVALVMGFAIAFGPFFAITGRVSNKNTAKLLLGDTTAEKSFFDVGAVPAPMPLAIWWQDNDDPKKNRVLWSIEALISETSATTRHFGLVFAIAGLFAWRRHVRARLGNSVLWVLCGLHALVLVRMTSRVGYLSERHTAMLVMCGCFPAALALTMLAGRLAKLRWRGQRCSTEQWLVAIIIAGVALSWPSLRKPLHYNRAGHRHAGEWLAQNAAPTARIRDPFCWAQYFAGRDFYDPAPADPDEHYVIIETSDNQHSRLPLMPEAKAKAAAGNLVYSWPASDKNEVRVYRWQRPPS